METQIQLHGRHSKGSSRVNGPCCDISSDGPHTVTLGALPRRTVQSKPNANTTPQSQSEKRGMDGVRAGVSHGDTGYHTSLYGSRFESSTD